MFSTLTMAGSPGPRKARPEDKLHEPAIQSHKYGVCRPGWAAPSSN